MPLPLIPLIGTAASLVGGFLDRQAADKRAAEAERQMQGAQRSFLGSVSDIAKNTYKKSQEQKDLEALMTGTKGGGVYIDPIQTIQAGQLDVLGEGGERALMAGSQNLVKNVYDLTEAERARTFGQEVAGRQSAAATAQDIANRNVGQKTMADQMKAGFYGDQFALAQQNVAGSEAAAASAFPTAVGNALQFASMLEGKNGLKIKYGSGGKVKQHFLGGIVGNAIGGLAGGFGTTVGNKLADAAMNKFGVGGEADNRDITITVNKNGETKTMNSGGLIEEILRKKDIYKTGGEFNHDTNKKALVDEESGVKEAELTGGEYVLNPQQGEEIHAQYETIEAKIQNGEPVSEEEWMMYHEAVKNVFSQPQFNEETA